MNEMNENGFEFAGVRYVSKLSADGCGGCAFKGRDCAVLGLPPCSESRRADEKDVIFIAAKGSPELPNQTKSDGSTASYYELPPGATQIRDLIQHRNMNHADGEIFCAIYRKGHCSHSDLLREARKVFSYAQAELERLEKLA